MSTGGAPRAGRLLGGRYRLGRALGRGGAAEVVFARDELLHVDRAVKLVVFEPGPRGEGLRGRLAAEARVMAALQHPNILRVTDLGREDDLDYIVMELALGGNLSTRAAERGPMPLEELLSVGLQLTSALAAAHAAGVIHRDVKPQNLLMGAAGQVQLADFGIAMLGHEGALRVTRTGAAMGSLAYMAPEQRLDASRVGPAADVYGAGATLFALATVENPVDLFVADPDGPRWLPVPPALRPLLQRATQLRPEDRFPSAAAFADALAALRGAGGPVLAADPAAEALSWLSQLGQGGSRLGAQTHQGAPFPGEANLGAPVAATLQPPAPAPAQAPAPDSATTASNTLISPIAPLRPWPAVALASLAAGLGVAFALTYGGDASAPIAADLAAQPAADPAATNAPGPAGDPVVEPVAEVDPALAPELGAAPPAAVAAPAPAKPAASGAAGRVDARPRAGDPVRDGAEPSERGPAGAWQLNFNGQQATLRLRRDGGPSALRGELVVTRGQNAVRNEVAGSYDAVARTLQLRDLDDAPDAGRYELRLSEDLDRIEGRFVRLASGTMVTLRGRRAP